MELIICHDEAILNIIINTNNVDAIINKENIIVVRVILLLRRKSLHLIVIINSNDKIVISYLDIII